MGDGVLLEGGSLRISRDDTALLRAGRLPEQMFFESVMARVETNKNRDRITPAMLREVAATIAHTPIDEEHKQGVVQGHILSARFDPQIYNPVSKTYGALLTSNVTWPRRFPDVALGLLDGSKKFSLEAAGEEVQCSACGALFATTVPEAEYCACLQSRRTTNATDRIWLRSRGIGAAFTTNPAGTDCEALGASIMLVAAYDEAASPERVEQMLSASVFAAQEQKEKGMEPREFEKLVASALAAVRAGKPGEGDLAPILVREVGAFVASERASLESAQAAAVAKAQAETEERLVAAHAAQIDAVKAEGQRALLAEQRVSVLRAIPGVANPEGIRDMVASFTEDQWQFALAGYRAAVPASAAPAPETPPATEPVGTQLLANAATGGGAAPTPASPTQGGGAPAGTPARPTSLSDWTFNRKKA
jgi:hypothetical protein